MNKKQKEIDNLLKRKYNQQQTKERGVTWKKLTRNMQKQTTDLKHVVWLARVNQQKDKLQNLEAAKEVLLISACLL